MEPPGTKPPILCPRCGTEMTLVTHVPSFGHDPGLDAFECLRCHAFDTRLDEDECNGVAPPINSHR
jgi:hypothetical protein